jgi:PAS domain S-box-containing protein
VTGEERRTEAALQDPEERLRLLIESVVDYAIFMLDPDGHIASWNVGAERIKGYTADEIIGRHFEIFYTPEARAARHPQHELEVAARDGRYEETAPRVRKNGELFSANVVITAIRDARGELVGFAKVTRDVTERERLIESREQLAASRIEFLALVAHELRTPVSMIGGSASMLHQYWRELSDEDRDELTGTLTRGADRLRRLVEDLLLASRLDAGALEMRVEDVDVVPVIRETVGEHARSHPGTAIHIDGPDRLVARADRTRLEQMLTNYISNSFRYGAPPVTVRARRAADGVEISVADRGDGVPEAAVPRLFEKFSGRQHRDSTGLGLFLVRAMARAQGGDAWYVAGDDGPRFVLRLPAA